ncbi:MAG: hypothetical protein IPG89_01265 [Bacteroidetes bacterium]|jgi:hypothetical protein|nr:hypothetical protein [Bacteroidota bacterium]
MKNLSNQLIQRFFTKKEIGGEISVNDLRDREFSGEKLSAEEKTALANYDAYRISVLNAQENDEDFHAAYRQLQVIANLGDWKEFLKEQYSNL